MTEAATAETAEATTTAATATEAAATETAATTEAAKTFTQEELGAIVKRERAAAEKAAKAKYDEDAKKAAMSAEEKIRAERDEALKASADTISRANAMLVRAEAKVAAATAGAVGDNAEAVIKLADLSGIEVAEDGSVDGKAIADAVTHVKGKFPALFGAAGTSRSGPDFQGGSGGKAVYTEAQIAAMTSEEFAKAQDDINAAMAEPGRPRLRSA